MQLSLLLWYERTDTPEGLSIIKCTLSCDGEVEIFPFSLGFPVKTHYSNLIDGLRDLQTQILLIY